MGHPMSAARSEMGLCEYAATCLRAVRRDFCSERRDPTDRDFFCDITVEFLISTDDTIRVGKLLHLRPSKGNEWLAPLGW